MSAIVVATVQGTNATIIFVHSLRREPRHLDATASRNAMSENAYTMAKKNIQKSSSTKSKNSSNALAVSARCIVRVVVHGGGASEIAEPYAPPVVLQP